MASKSDRVGELLQALAYRDFDFDLAEGFWVGDYDPRPDEREVSAEAEKQIERHLLLHHSSQCGSSTDVRDDWCFECTKQFLSHWFGSFSIDILGAIELAKKDKPVAKEAAIKLAMNALGVLDQRRSDEMHAVTAAVSGRERLANAERAEKLDALVERWDRDDDRTTDFYLEWLGKRFKGMIDRAEKLNTIPARGPVPESVQLYLVEASRCFIFGQYIACLLVCRSVLIFSLEDYLVREGKELELAGLREKQSYAVGPLVTLARALNKWRMKPTLDDAWEVGRRANDAVHSCAPSTELCRELFIKTRGILKELYS